jgi:hypothetical protein
MKRINVEEENHLFGSSKVNITYQIGPKADSFLCIVTNKEDEEILDVFEANNLLTLVKWARYSHADARDVYVSIATAPTLSTPAERHLIPNSYKTPVALAKQILSFLA